MSCYKVFSKRTQLDFPASEVFAWHSRPGALERLIPPWDNLQLISREGGIEKGAQSLLKLRFGPFPILWQARHTEYEPDRFFQDVQLKGPFAHWVHSHFFEPLADERCGLEDRIEYRLPVAILGNMLLGGMVRNHLERTFRYRHAVLAHDLKAHGRFRDKPPLTVLVSGASGLIGSALVPFLTTGGHRVVKLVRKAAAQREDEVFWDPASGQIDSTGLGKIDAVIHLAGENIGNGRWTAAKKKRIIDSRIKGTGLLADAVAKLDPKPRVFLSASAIGFYGDRGDALLSEASEVGSDFISQVCKAWEEAATVAWLRGMRPVFLRIGVVLTPAGGALARLLPPFQAGLGGRLGAGKQFMSWISMDDVLGAILHCLYNPQIEGPVNLVSPEPMPNRDFVKTLARVLKRPAFCPVPESMVRLIFGQMGREVVLASSRVSPNKLLDNGYRFQHPELGGALNYLLGVSTR